MGRFKRRSKRSKSTNYNLTEQELKFITENTSFTTENIIDWHKVRYVNLCPISAELLFFMFQKYIRKY